jgi:uncharacterized protein
MSQLYSLNTKEKNFCLKIARDSIRYFLENEKMLVLEGIKIPEKLFEQKACFVTLTVDGELRGCIGHLESSQPLFREIIQNAFLAAMEDNRFSPLTKKEFGSIKIEVSILTDALEISFSDPKDLLTKITPKKDGLIIKKGHYGATFLPSVWEQIKKKEDFISQLCLKAGLDFDDWTKKGMKVYKYETIKAKEK